jgi:hypothetical protein
MWFEGLPFAVGEMLVTEADVTVEYLGPCEVVADVAADDFPPTVLIFRELDEQRLISYTRNDLASIVRFERLADREALDADLEQDAPG